MLYPLGYLLVARPVACRVAGPLPWLVTAAACGVVLWAFAVFAVAYLVAGDPPFLGFTDVTWVALSGHVLYAVVLAWGIGRRA